MHKATTTKIVTECENNRKKNIYCEAIMQQQTRERNGKMYMMELLDSHKIKIIPQMKIPLKFIKCTYFNFRKPILVILLIFVSAIAVATATAHGILYTVI